MKRIDSGNEVADKFGAGKPGFADGKTEGQDPTNANSDWFDDVQEEISNAIEFDGTALDGSDKTQLLAAMQRIVSNSRQAPFCARNWQTGPAQPMTAAAVNSICGAYYNDQHVWVAVGNPAGGQAGIYVAGSAAGVWEPGDPVTVPKNFGLNDVTYDAVTKATIAVGEADGADALIYRSTNAFVGNPTEIDNARNVPLKCVHAAASGAVLAAGSYDGSDIYALLSTDGGLSWVEKAMAGASGSVAECIASAGTTFIIGGRTSGLAPLMWISTDDGANIAPLTPPTGFTDVPKSIVYDGTRFVMLGDDGQVATSVTGLSGTWALQSGLTLVFAGSAWDLAADTQSGLIIAIAGDGTNGGDGMRLSDDGGATWSRLKCPAIGLGPDSKVWTTIACDGTAWAMCMYHGNEASLYGAQSLVME